eukprot:GEMP01020038.1.p1 GENE.GEMP01020038.1~~GEMP01020038.1.p1  ORF type:complete len:458 (+),score=119.33 GEMP01020038.1:39-1412(+)
MDSTSLYHGVNTILAPMVRASTLAMRLECIDYGAGLVYSEETIAKKVLECRRVINPHFPDIVEFYSDREGTPAFRTCAAEKKKLVFQLGVATAAIAQEAALIVCNDVSGIDINMGCPKSFSVKGGMGAALMRTPEIAADILKTVRRTLPTHVALSCKTRLYDDLDKTADFVKMLHASGAEVVALHMRTERDRPSTRARWDEFAKLKDMCPGIHLIANGDFFTRKRMEEFQSRVGANALMVARGAQYDPSIFSATSVAREDVVRRYTQRSIAVGATYQTVKWNLATMVTTSDEVFQSPSKEWNNKLTACKSLHDIAALCRIPYDRAVWPAQCHSVHYFKNAFRSAIGPPSRTAESVTCTKDTAVAVATTAAQEACVALKGTSTGSTAVELVSAVTTVVVPVVSSAGEIVPVASSAAESAFSTASPSPTRTDSLASAHECHKRVEREGERDEPQIKRPK